MYLIQVKDYSASTMIASIMNKKNPIFFVTSSVSLPKHVGPQVEVDGATAV